VGATAPGGLFTADTGSTAAADAEGEACAVPQSGQNFARGGSSLPQPMQRAGNGVPLSTQKRARSGFVVWQVEQSIRPQSTRRDPVLTASIGSDK